MSHLTDIDRIDEMETLLKKANGLLYVTDGRRPVLNAAEHVQKHMSDLLQSVDLLLDELVKIPPKH